MLQLVNVSYQMLQVINQMVLLKAMKIIAMYRLGKNGLLHIVLILTVVAMIFEKQLGVKLYVSAWVGALVLVATNVISETAAVKSIDMKTIMLFAGSMALGDAMVKTGTGSVIADIIVNSLGASPSPIVVLVVIFVLGVFMTNFMSNTATCALLVPIGLSLASQLGIRSKSGACSYRNC